MPETAVNEDDFFVSRKNDVGFALKFRIVQTETKAETMNDRANDDFGFGVAAFDRRHIPFALFGSEIVSHFLRRTFVVNDFGIRARDDEFARPAAEILFQIFIEPKTVFENLGFKVRDFFEKTTRCAVVVRIEKREKPFVMTGDKGEIIFTRGYLLIVF